MATRLAKTVFTLLAALGPAAGLCFIDIAGLQSGAKITLGLFLLAAVLWMTEVVPLYVTSLIVLAVEVLWLVPVLQGEGVEVSKEAFMAPFFCDITLLFLGGLLLSCAGNKYRIDRWLAARILNFVGGKPANVLLGLIVTSAWLSMWMSNTATTAMMLIIALAISEDLPSSDTQFKKALFLGVPFACNLGGMATPVGSPPNAIAIAFLEKAGVSVSFLTWMLLSAPLVLILLLILWMALLKYFPAPQQHVKLQESATFPKDWKALGTALVFGTTVLLWLSGGVHGLSSGTVALFAVISLLGFRILDSKDFRGVNWDVLYLVGGGIALGIAMSKSGLSAWLVGVLPLEGMGSLPLLAVFILSGMLLTTFMSNTATANILIPLALSMQAEFTPLAVGVALAASSSMSLPVSTPPNAIAYYSGEIELREMLRIGALVSVASALLLTVAGATLWKLFAL